MQGGDRRDITGRIGLGEAQHFGVGERRVEGQREVAAGIDNGAADVLTRCIGDGHCCAGFAAPCDGDAVTGNRQLCRCGWRRGIGRGDDAGARLVAGGVGQQHLHLLPVGLRRGEVDLEGAIDAHGVGAQHTAVGSDHPHGDAWLACPVEQAATASEGQVLCRCWRGAVWRGKADAVRFVTGHIGLAGIEQLAVQLCRGQRGAEVASSIDHGSAEFDTAFASDGHGSTRFAAAGYDQAVARQHQAGER